MGLIEELKEFRDKMGGDYISATVMGGGNVVSIYIRKDEEPELDIQTEESRKKDAEPRPEFEQVCPECGKKFMAKSKRPQMCPDCKKKSHLESMKKYHEKKRNEKPIDNDIASTVQQLISLEDK